MTKSERERMNQPPAKLGIIGYSALSMMLALIVMVLYTWLGR